MTSVWTPIPVISLSTWDSNPGSSRSLQTRTKPPVRCLNGLVHRCGQGNGLNSLSTKSDVNGISLIMLLVYSWMITTKKKELEREEYDWRKSKKECLLFRTDRKKQAKVLVVVFEVISIAPFVKKKKKQRPFWRRRSKFRFEEAEANSVYEEEKQTPLWRRKKNVYEEEENAVLKKDKIRLRRRRRKRCYEEGKNPFTKKKRKPHYEEGKKAVFEAE